MKYRVKAKISFIDKYTQHVYAVDEEIECTEERGKELLSDKRGLVEFVKEINDEEPQKEEPHKADESVTVHLDADQLKTWKKDELVKLAQDMGLDSKGTKEELIEKIVAEEVEIDDEAIIEEDEKTTETE